ncbi:MAG: efflux RND transporter permease subunit, partial [Leptospiraceae bacterium]|nr:efflux RND transporter permease subunit [Leptospiraceae bacterium]
MKRITRYLIERPLQVHLIVIFIVLVAIASLGRIRRVGLPLVDMGEILIMTVYPGASPEDVELNLTRKLEDSLGEVQGIEKYLSESMENLSSIFIRLDPDADFQEVQDDIRRAIDRVGDLPAEVEDDPEIIVYDTADMTVYEVGLIVTDGSELHTLRPAARRLKDALLELDMVSRVEENGSPEPEIKILLNKDAMRENYISFGEVIQAIQTNKVRISGGSLESYTSSLGIVTLSDFGESSDIGNLIIASNDVGNQVRLKEIASIQYGSKDQDVAIRINGHPGMYLSLAIKRGSDMLAAVETIEARIDRFKKEYRLPPGMELVKLRDESVETRLRLNIVLQNAVAGFVLVMAVLFLFFNRRIAFWTAMGIPVAVAVALIGIPLLDITVNRISLLGLIVVLGMLVDDSIIIAESIFRELQTGSTPEDAAVNGLMRVLRPVISTVLTTVLAFLPLYFLGGPVGDFSVEIPTVVILMLGGSLLEALFILPAHLGHAKKIKATIAGESEAKGRSPGDQDIREARLNKEPPGARWIQALEEFYMRSLHYLLKQKWSGAYLVLALFLVLGAGVLLARFEMFPVDQAWRLWIYGETAEDANLNATLRETA